MLYDVEGYGDHPRQGALAAAGRWPRHTAGPGPRLQLACKRLIDIGAALLLLVLFTLPMLLIAAAIRLFDGAPVLYRQLRYGRGGVPFVILKFRTMTCDEPGSRFSQAQADDPRVTRLGAFLRRTSLDELPQLFNVLRGDMALVGPRPHPIAMEQRIVAEHPRAARRLAMRPGMTGLAQIRGLRGPTSTDRQLRGRIDADIEYVEIWTLWRDIVIMIYTPVALVLGENAL